MAADGGEIDLYADDLEHEFNQDNEYNNDQMVDLYDDVITASGNVKREHSHEDDYNGNDESNHSHTNSDHHSLNANLISDSSQSSIKKIGIYVGNLTWWTTDQDIIESINGIGISDIIEVKFFENRANGQSKGFCVVTLGSETSVRVVLDKLPKTELHGQNPVVTTCNKQNLNHFEMQSRKVPGGAGNQQMAGHQSGPRNYGGPQSGGAMRPPLISRPQRPNGPLIPGQPRMPMPQGNVNFGQGQPPWHGGMQPQGGPPRGGPPMHGGGPQRPGMPMMRMPPNNRGPGPQPLLRAPGPPGDPRAQHPQQMQEWGDHQGHGHPPPQPNNMSMGQGTPNNAPMPPRPPVPGMPPVVGGPHPGPAPHVNPAFFQPQHQGVPSSQAADPYNRVTGGPNQYCGDYRGPLGAGDSSLVPQLSDEFEEQIAKNRAVSSSAISRAVSDASSGDYGNAIETLVTAISLIKQSKVANDERCKILVSSLQDTLHGIENKSYSSRNKERPRSRERSRERSSRREKSSRRDRSRSREREYRERSRERSDRYHEDRYHEESSRYREKDRERDRDRDRDRDREREHRSSRH